MKSLGIVCLLFIFVARGSCRSCDYCHNVGKDCDGYTTECDSPEDQCGTVLLEISSGKTPRFLPIKGETFSADPGDIAYNIKGCTSSCPELTLSNRTHEERRNELIKVECTDAFKTVPSN
ncbi:PREDICTED: phospholipase A2 inhibitor subunit gamma A-like [Thamnophis sirtalis]|uniref:Phospholipase A2 inhibitor subunit gamma A-like n=1 Tax=Thamnophis sirtalis TaxID=35019 RepID=A0A6I9Z031_9SAUR|nr:PREDICTED: phospholipase A2 inhibitor subunit gamma A-like [Thamnophis sirtalis]